MVYLFGRTTKHLPLLEMEDTYSTLRLNKKGRWYSKLCIFCMLFCIMSLVIGLLYLLELYHPIAKTAPLPSELPSDFVPSVTVPPEDMDHREEMRHNSFLTLLHQTHQVIDKNNCWICMQFPAYVDEGIPLLQVPLPFEASCYALHIAMLKVELIRVFSSLVTSRSTTRTSTTSLYTHYDKDILQSGNCSEVILPNATFPFSNIFTPLSLVKNDSTPPLHRDTREIPFLKMRQRSVLGSICIRSNGTANMGNSTNCNMTFEVSSQEITVPLYVGDSVYFICGSRAYIWLPVNWGGCCHLGLVTPALSVKSTAEVNRASRTLRGRRSVDQGDTVGEIAGDVLKAFVPWYGPAINSRNIRRLSRLLEATIEETAGVIENITVELKALRLVALQNRVGPDMMLAERGGVCRVIGSSCCTYVPDSSTSVREAVKRLYDIGAQAHSDVGPWDPVGSFWNALSAWGWKIGMFLVTIFLVVIGCCVLINCLPMCCQCLGRMLKPPPMPPVTVTNALIMRDIVTQQLMDIDISDNSPTDTNTVDYVNERNEAHYSNSRPIYEHVH
ncbi:uncharacterized protein LOC144827141 [Lissotriton helveticus]